MLEGLMRASRPEDDGILFHRSAGYQAATVENGRRNSTHQRCMEESRVLLEVASIVNSTLDWQTALNLILDKAVELLQAEAGSLVLVDQDSGELVFEVTAGPGSADLVGTCFPPGTGIVGAVVREGEAILITEAQTDRRWYRGLDDCTEFVTQSIIAVPMLSRGRTIGVIELLNRCDGAPFDRDDERLLTAFAANAAVAIANARLYEEAKRRLAEVEMVQEVMLAAASTLDFDLVLERTVKALCRVLGVNRLGFLLPDEPHGTLVLHPSLVGWRNAAQADFHIPMGGSLVGQAYRTGQPVLVRDLTQDPAYLERAPDVRSALAVPVRAGDRVIAVLHAESPQVGAFGEDEMRLCTTIAGQLGVTLENARLYQKSEEMNRLRRELVQNVGHELRTPLGLIKGYVELLMAGDLGPVHDSQRQALEVIHERTATLARLIHNLTMLQAIPRTALSLAPVAVVEVVQWTLAEFRRPAKQAGIVWQEDIPADLPPALGDRERLEQVLGHLVDNAVKFSPDGGTVTIRAWADQESIYVSVADEGIGIAPEHVGRIFERFYQADGTTTRRFGGMGVGLAVVWEIVEAHGGTVAVESEPGWGSTFTVALPQA